MQMNEFITTEEASKVLWVTAYTIREYIKKGKLKAVRIGKHYLIAKAEVEKLLNTMV